VQPGSNDVLIRGSATGGSVILRYRGRVGVTATLPEKVGSATLAQRLKEGAGKGDAVPPEFLKFDWPLEAKKGDAEQGRKLFGTLGCVKCHAITADQAGGGAPSLTDAGKRFNLAYLVESMLLPSRQVAEQFRTTVITTKQGLTLTGLVVSETGRGHRGAASRHDAETGTQQGRRVADDVERVADAGRTGEETGGAARPAGVPAQREDAAAVRCLLTFTRRVVRSILG